MAAITSHIPSLRRQIKNVACNYSDAQVKVREATSNDPWGASSSLMSEIADLTYNTMAFTEIMQMIWKRLNDHGKNWRHVYKSLVLLDYLIKVGSEKVAQQCRENVYAIQTLKDFQHIEDNKDQGMNVREKAKQLVAILKDDERLKNERAKALMARKRFTQNGTGVGSDGRRFEMSRSDECIDYPVVFESINETAISPKSNKTNMNSNSNNHMNMNMKFNNIDSSNSNNNHHYNGGGKNNARSRRDSELEECRPTSSGEEELQLQIALAISKEEADKETEARKNDDMRLQLALQESQTDGETRRRPISTGTNAFGTGSSSSAGVSDYAGQSASTKNTSALDDLLSLQPSMPTYSSNAWGQSSTVTETTDFFKAASLPSLAEANLSDPWGQGQQGAGAGAAPIYTLHQGDPFGDHMSTNSAGGFGYSNDPWSSNQANFDAVNGQYNSAQASANLSGISNSPDPWGSDALSPAPLNTSGGQSSSASSTNTGNSAGQSRKLKTPDNFLGENSSLVNLENLMAGSMKSAVLGMPPKTGGSSVTNPFASSTAGGANNPFLANQRATPPTLNEIRATSVTNQQKVGGAASSSSTNQSAWPSTNQNQTQFNGTVTSPGSTNPFL